MMRQRSGVLLSAEMDLRSVLCGAGVGRTKRSLRGPPRCLASGRPVTVLFAGGEGEGKCRDPVSTKLPRWGDPRPTHCSSEARRSIFCVRDTSADDLTLRRVLLETRAQLRSRVGREPAACAPDQVLAASQRPSASALLRILQRRATVVAVLGFMPYEREGRAREPDRRRRQRGWPT